MSRPLPGSLAEPATAGAPLEPAPRPLAPTNGEPRRIGILAGGGRLPLTIAEHVIADGGSVHIVGIEGEADAGIARFPHTWVNWGHAGRMVSTLRRHADALVIAGGVRRPNLWKIRPDLGFLLSLPQILEMMAGGGDDSVLSRVVRFFEAKGIEVRGAHQVAPSLLVRGGPAGTHVLEAQARADADLGFAVRAALGPLDAGQAVVVADGKVLAIEGAEGTDAMLGRIAASRSRRTADEHSAGERSGVLAKGPKPGQELRVDMPTIGPRTVENMAAAGLAGLAIEADAVLLLDRADAVRAANASGIAIEGLPNVPPLPAIGAVSSFEDEALHTVGQLKPHDRASGDIHKGLAAVERLSSFQTGQAVVVARAYILAVAAAEPISAMLERTRALRQWGVGAKRRVGVLTFRAEAAEPWDAVAIDSLLGQAATAGLAGVAVTGPAAALAAFADAGGCADAHGLFLVTREEDH